MPVMVQVKLLVDFPSFFSSSFSLFRAGTRDFCIEARSFHFKIQATMSGLYVTPTEALLQVAKQHPFKAAVKCGEDEWSYAALWARVRQIADRIPGLGDAGNAIGLHMG